MTELWPLSAAQKGIWLGQQLDLHSPNYNAAEYIEIFGAIKPEVFKRALAQLIREAEALRVRFVSTDLGPRQQLCEAVDWQLEQLDLSERTDPKRAARQWFERDLARPVDLDTGPVFHHALIKLGPAHYVWYQRIHHIASDGFGFALLARRLAAIYSNLLATPDDSTSTPDNQTPALDRLYPVIEEDRAYHDSRFFERDRLFWIEHLRDMPAPPRLSGGSASVSQIIVRAGRQLEADFFRRLQRCAQQWRQTWPDLVLAAVAAWMHRRTGAREIILGVPFMGRMGTAALRVPAMVMNILPLRIAVAGGASFRELVTGVAAEMQTIRPHQRYRYEQLRRDLNHLGGDRRLFGPVVNIMPFENRLDFAGHKAMGHNISAGPVEDLSISVYTRGGGLKIEIDANPGNYTAVQIEDFLTDLLTHFQNWLAAPETVIAPEANNLAWLDGAELAKQLPCVLQKFIEQSQRQRQKVALIDGDKTWTYAELNAQAQRFAWRLQCEKNVDGKLVAVLLPRSGTAIVAILGIMMAGGAYLALDPDGPEARNRSILTDARPALGVVGPAPPAWVAQLPCISVEDCAAAPAALPMPAADSRLAYVIYTSGSTGTPKGVMISRRALAAFVAGAGRCYGIEAEDRVLQFAPLHFDTSVEEIFLSLCRGATLLIRNDAMLESMSRFVEICREWRITVLDLPTAFWHELVLALAEKNIELPETVHTTIIGGEAALPERVARWHRAVSEKVRLLNTYGPSETTVVATVAELRPGDSAITIGVPLAGRQVAVIDAQGQLVSRDEEGELVLLGAGLGSGYLGRAELTAEKFTPLALPGVSGWRTAYRTGDRAKIETEGRIVFLGRINDEFKISGHRIDPAEVESALLGLAGVREVAVIGHSDSGTKYLAAYVVKQEAGSADVTSAQLRRQLLQILPAAMVPTAMHFLPGLPKNAAGKIDRRALRAIAPEGAGIESDQVYTAAEKKVVDVWQRILGRVNIGVNENFFEIGGQSLQVIQVANRLSSETGCEIAAQMIFQNPTVAELALLLERASAAPGSVRNDIATAGPSEPTPLILEDSRLSLSLVPKLDASPIKRSQPRRILLTGASGFVGAYLLHQLLQRTRAEILCPVRAASEEAGVARLKAALETYSLAGDDFATRVRAIPADLCCEKLGLSGEAFTALGEGLDAVVHNAAVTSVIRDYGSLRAANVLATKTLLGLAAQAQTPVPFHLVSTLAVVPAVGTSEPEAFCEYHSGLRDGYQQTKWVSERLVQQAGERGLPVSVFRLGRVTGAPATGYINPKDLIWQILAAGLPLRVLPDIPVTEPWTPVDFVSGAIVTAAFADEPARGVFHVVPASEIRLSTLFKWVQEFGFDVDILPVSEWCERLRGCRSAEAQAMLAFFEQNKNSAPVEKHSPSQKNENGQFTVGEKLTEKIDESGLHCPETDKALFYRYLEYAVRENHIPPPSKTHHLPLPLSRLRDEVGEGSG